MPRRNFLDVPKLKQRHPCKPRKTNFVNAAEGDNLVDVTDVADNPVPVCFFD